MSFGQLKELAKEGRFSVFTDILRDEYLSLTHVEADQLGHILKKNNSSHALNSASIRGVDINVIASGTVIGIANSLRLSLAYRNIMGSINESGFNQWRFDLLKKPKASIDGVKAFTLCVLDDSIIFDKISYTENVSAVSDAMQASLADINQLVANFFDNTEENLIISTPILSREYCDVLLDAQSRANLNASWHEYVAGLLRLSEQYKRLRVIDSQYALQDALSSSDYRDSRMFHIARMAWTPQALRCIADAATRIIAADIGVTKKCLVSDLDNTLWGGILGDDGWSGVEIESGDFGNAFESFQQAIVALSRQGVILCANSKNDEDNVKAFIAQQNMPLSIKDFAMITANWEAKSGNIKHISQVLNIDTNSMVFIDDSAFECAEIRNNCPEVMIHHLDVDPFFYTKKLLRDGSFDRTCVTPEDRNRNSSYAAEAQRVAAKKRHINIEEFLLTLNLNVVVEPATPHTVERASQITLRTNQFNLSGMRLTEGEMRNRLSDDEKLTYVVRASDKYGDYGIVGLILAAKKNDTLILENLYLSCRVFSRGIEKYMLAFIVDACVDLPIRQIFGLYRGTKKNANFAKLYPDSDFEFVSEDDDGTLTFSHQLASEIYKPHWINAA